MSQSPGNVWCRRGEGPGIRVALVRTGWWLAFAFGLPLSCGGNAFSESAPVGPVHEGMGQYALFVETLHDDCMPAFPSGDLGRVVVAVATDLGADGHATANIPTSVVPEGSPFQPPRSDISLSSPMGFDLPSPTPGCSAQSHLEVTPLAANSAGIDVECEQTFTGSGACQADELSVRSDCTADRIFHFKWLRACPPGNVVADCL